MHTHALVSARRTRAAIVRVALPMLASCSDSTGPAASAIGPAEAQAVQSLLMRSPELSSFSAFSSAVLSLAGSVGTLSMSPVLSSTIANAVIVAGVTPQRAIAGDYRVVGVLVNMTITGPGSSTPISIFGLIGWNGVSPSAQTIENLVFVGALGSSAVTVNGSGFTANIGGTGVGALVRRVPAAIWNGTSGTFSVSSWSSSGSRNCSQNLAGVGNVTCSMSAGQMNGSFGFAVSPGASGALTFPTTTFTGVPLVVISVSVAQ